MHERFLRILGKLRTYLPHLAIATAMAALMTAGMGILGKLYLDERSQATAQQVSLLERQLMEQNEELKIALLHLNDLKRQEVTLASSGVEGQITGAVAAAAPSVVSIVISKDVPKLEIVYQNPFGDNPFFRDVDLRMPVYRQQGKERRQVGAGTGVIVTTDGYIATNRHVVDDPSALYSVLLSDGQKRSARVIYRDAAYDLAILKIDGSYRPASLGNSDSLKLGQTVIAIGNALGEYNNSVSVGIVSGLNRTIEAGGYRNEELLEGVIQTDAAINLGNSGGPLLDASGRIVGINVATVTGSNSIGFSIPVNALKTVLKNAGISI